MALSKFNTRALAHAHMASKSRRRRLVLLSSRHLQPISPRMRPSKPSLSTHQRTIPPPEMTSLTDDKASPPRSRIAFKFPPKKKKNLASTSDVSVKLNLDPAAAEPHDSSPVKDLASSVKDQSPGNEIPSSDDRHLPLYDSIETSVQRLQVPHVPMSPSNGVATHHLTPCKSTAKRKLDELLRDLIAFVPATKATTDTEPARKKRRVMSQDRGERIGSAAHFLRDYSRPDLGATGMQNHNGAICYRRSVYQVLMNTTVFVNWIKLHGVDPLHACTTPNTPKKLCLACALRDLANAYWPSGNAPRNKTSIDYEVRKLDSVLNRLGCVGGGRNTYYEQQDAHEFLCDILKFLEAAQPQAKEEFNALFGLKRVRVRHCTRCRTEDRTFDPVVEQNLAVNIRHPRKGLGLEEYVDQTFREVNGGIRCATCKREVPHVYTQHVLDGPQVLLVQLTRFDWTGRHARKLGDPVPLKPYLDLSRHFEDGRMQRPGKLKYRLSGIVLHGGGVSSGHYVAKVVTPNGIQEANDSSITGGLALQDLLRAKDDNFTPYILAYTKVHE